MLGVPLWAYVALAVASLACVAFVNGGLRLRSAARPGKAARREAAKKNARVTKRAAKIAKAARTAAPPLAISVTPPAQPRHVQLPSQLAAEAEAAFRDG